LEIEEDGEILARPKNKYIRWVSFDGITFTV